MRLPFLRSKQPAAKTTRAERSRPAAADESTLVEAARTRARRRLMGALVLLVIGVVGFPILFETQPRPLPVDTPIVAPSVVTARREPPVAAPPQRPAMPRPGMPPAIEAPAPVAAAEPPPPAPEPAPVAAPVRMPASAPPVVGASERATLPASAVTPAAVVAGASAPASASGAGRFVVQVGAYTDATTLREARLKVEKMGLKTYTQVINSDAGPRTRVRLGPYATRDEADAAAAKLKRAGLPANILAL